MPLPPSPLARFAMFVRRFAPFWMVWLLIAALPATREPLQIQILGSPFTPQLNPSWREDLSPDSRFDSFALVKARPGDLNARLWRLKQMMDGRGAGFSKNGEQYAKFHRPAELLAEANAIRAGFKDEWLASLPIRVFLPQLLSSSGSKKPLDAARVRELVALLQGAARAEPQNAYYPLLEAGIWRRNRDFDAMWAALKRASSGKVYDDHDLQWAGAIVRAHDAARPLILEEKAALWRSLREEVRLVGEDWPPFLLHEARLAQGRGDHRRAIEIGVMLGGIGDLMQRGSNSPATALGAQTWKNSVRMLNTVVDGNRRRVRPALRARNFALYAAAHGRPDVAALSRGWAAREVEIARLFGEQNYSPITPRARRDVFWSVEFWRNAGAFVGAHLIFCAVAWLLINMILWRAVGAPSSARARTFPALFLALGNAGMAWWSWLQIDFLMSARLTRGVDHFAFAVSSVIALAFCGAPFLLAVWAAVATMRRHKGEFLKPARIETELRLSPGQTTLLKMGPTILCAAALVATLGFWLLWLGLVAFNVTTLDPFGWLSGIPSIGPLPIEWLIAPLIYCLFLDFLAFLLWFNKWRYYSGKESRPLTHGGLRGWKESLGIYLVLGSAIYGGVGVCGWPARAEASRALETKMTRGELAP